MVFGSNAFDTFSVHRCLQTTSHDVSPADCTQTLLSALYEPYTEAAAGELVTRNKQEPVS